MSSTPSLSSSFVWLFAVFFFFLVLYQILVGTRALREGMDDASGSSDSTGGSSSDSSSNDPLVLSKENTADIQSLKGRVDTLEGYIPSLKTLSSDVDDLKQKVAGLMQQQQAVADNMSDNTPTDSTMPPSPSS
jgi:preprotein translocase subunit SecF